MTTTRRRERKRKFHDQVTALIDELKDPFIDVDAAHIADAAEALGKLLARCQALENHIRSLKGMLATNFQTQCGEVQTSLHQQRERNSVLRFNLRVATETLKFYTAGDNAQQAQAALAALDQITKNDENDDPTS